MENSARIRISVDDSALRDLRRSANELYRTISEQAQQQERGTIATSRNIQEQIESGIPDITEQLREQEQQPTEPYIPQQTM